MILVMNPVNGCTQKGVDVWYDCHGSFLFAAAAQQETLKLYAMVLC